MGVAHDHEHLHAEASDAAVAAAVEALRARGERVTAPRRAVLAVLAAHAEHLSADEVAALVDGDDVHRATVYRTLEMLTDAGVVSHRHVAGDAARYHLAATGAGSEHLHGHCRECGRVVVLPPDAFDHAVEVLRRDAGFALEVRQSSFVGLCAACARP
ncbi:MAG: transcriptional repressor [Microbacterium sp.]